MDENALTPQVILNRIFVADLIETEVVAGTANPGTDDTKYSEQDILNRVFENNKLRIILI